MAPLAHRLRSVRSVNNPKQISRTRAARKPISYREQTSDSDEEVFEESVSDDDIEAAPSRPQRNRVKPQATLPASPKSKTPKKRKASGPGHKRPMADIKKLKIDDGSVDPKAQSGTPIQLTGKIMPWSTLPYHILLAIFDYASRPLINDMTQPSPSIQWLCSVALCCKAFVEPALSALYYAPPLYPPSRAHQLLLHLSANRNISTFNYGAKIKYLDVEAYSTMLRKYDGYDPLDLGALVGLTPQLRGIALHLRSDSLAWRKSGRSRSTVGGKAVYHQSTITALRENNIMLQDWTWNHSLAKQSQNANPLAQMKDFHNAAPFRTLRSLTFVNYPARVIEKGRSCEDMLAEAINLLPALTDLHFHMCCVNDHLLRRLPNDLQTLEVVECPMLDSSSLVGFLVAKGGNMRQLHLDHNQYLNLSFLTELAHFCPKLESFKADLRYFGRLNATRDTDPKYEALLFDGERPTWPATLRNLELFHLRKWSFQTAELFFSSLTESSHMLPDLRQLRIKASLDESGWRERIAFRDNWTEKLRRVFLRKSPPPNPHLKSISSFKAFKAQQKRSNETTRGHKQHTLTQSAGSILDNENTISANYIEGNTHAISKDASESDSDSDTPLVNVRRSTRPKPQREINYNLSSSSSPSRPSRPHPPQRRRRRRRRHGSSSSLSSEDSAIDDDDDDRKPNTQLTSSSSLDRVREEATLHIQGLCDVVDILIDNLRPTEEQLNENDFLDEEVSGDEDWNGDDDEVDGGYAW